jgi:phage-related protein
VAELKRQLDFASDAAERDYKDLPLEIVRSFGFQLRQVQQDATPAGAKVLKGFGGAGVVELKEDDDQNRTFRAVYTTQIDGWIYVLHAFNKKSHKGIATDKADVDTIKRRLKEAHDRHKALGRDKKGDP